MILVIPNLNRENKNNTFNEIGEKIDLVKEKKFIHKVDLVKDKYYT